MSDFEAAFEEALNLLDDYETSTPMPIETEEDRKLAMGFLLWRWKNSLFE